MPKTTKSGGYKERENIMKTEKYKTIYSVEKVLTNSYLCKCKCWNTIIVPASKLLNKHTRSCGCLFHNSTQKAVETKKRNNEEILQKQIRALVLNPEPTFRNKTSRRKGGEVILWKIN